MSSNTGELQQDAAGLLTNRPSPVAFGAIPAATALPALPGDGAALPQIAASLGSSSSALAQIAATLSTLQAQPSADLQASQRELGAILARLAELLAKAKVGTTINSGDIILRIDSEGKDARELALDIRRALEELSMADFGRPDRWARPDSGGRVSGSVKPFISYRRTFPL